MKFVTDFNKIAMKYDGREVSYKETIEWSKSYGERLDIQKEERVLVFMENRPEYIYSFLSIWDKKGTCVCIDCSFDAKTLEYYIKDADAKYIFVSKETEEIAREAIEALGIALEILVVDELEDSYAGDVNYLEHPEKDAVALMLYTSGTTGDPKGVMLTYDNILVNVEGLNEHNIYDINDKVLAILPFHHIFPLLGAGIIPLSKGATIVFLKEVSKTAIAESFKENEITMVIAIPRLYEMFHKGIMEKINSNKVAKALFGLCEKLQNKNLSKKIFKKVHEGFGGEMKYFVAGGAKLEPQVAKDFLTLGLDVLEGYGMTETAPMMAFTPGGQVVPGSAGIVLEGTQMKIADDGEILAKGRHVMKGYFNKPEATAETIIDGWMHTGDLGELKGDRIYITGRKKEMIVLSNGKNINPLEIEAFIMKNSNLVQEVAVTEYNNLLTLVVYPDFQKVKEEGVTNIRETLKWGVVDKYNHNSPTYRKVLAIEVVGEELPKTRIGKIRRFKITEFLDGLVNKEEVIVEEPDFEEYKVLADYLKGVKGKGVVPTSHLELDLGLDSLELVELLSYLENTFGIIANEDLLLENSTVEKLARYLEKHSDEIVDTDVNWGEILNKKIEVELPKSNCLGIIAKNLFKPIFKFHLKHTKLSVNNTKQSPVIFAGNHQSFADGAILNEALSNDVLKNTYYMAKVKHFDSPKMKKVANNANVLVVDINKNLTETLQTLATVLKSGKNVVIFPEGVRSRDGHIGEFKKSFAILSKELNIPIVPFGIKGAYEAFPTGSKMPKAGRVEIRFFDAIEPKGLDYAEIVEKTQSTIKEWVEK